MSKLTLKRISDRSASNISRYHRVTGCTFFTNLIGLLNTNYMIKIVECPRDAMQGIDPFIPTEKKINYINHLLQVGFDAIDFGSFVSPKAIPQMRDTATVVAGLDWENSSSGLLAIVANERGAKEAAQFQAIRYLGFPLSISETFQQRNTNKSIAGALEELEKIKAICTQAGKALVTYISMGFGNPYGDPYNPEIVLTFVEKLVALGTTIVSLADTVGVATPEEVTRLFATLVAQYPDLPLGVHLHAAADTARAKVEAALAAGCKRFDGALKGFGGCPMAKDELVGNIPTEVILQCLAAQGMSANINKDALQQASRLADEIFLR